MIDLTRIENYRENNRIEAKKALGGLPKSIWETYSAFANTLGGIILLGVEEHRDRSLTTVDLPDPERLVREFLSKLNNPLYVSTNILSDKHIQIATINGNRIVAITVPRARRSEKPVYIGGSPISGTYRRNGEGDYRCTREQIEAMLRDATEESQDMKIIENLALDVINFETLHRYRKFVSEFSKGASYLDLSDEAFLCHIDAVGVGNDGIMHPTVAGLLMFGKEKDITAFLPAFNLEYSELSGQKNTPVYHVVSGSGNWSGNIFDFYLNVSRRLCSGFASPLELEKQPFSSGSSVCIALREAVANSLINADHFGVGGISVTKENCAVIISNPGAFRIDIDKAKTGGISDSRNSALAGMFNLINAGNRSGSGIPNIFSVWKSQGWIPPQIEESFQPERITVTLPLTAPNAHTNPSPDKKHPHVSSAKAIVHRSAIIEYLTYHTRADCADIASLIGCEQSVASAILSDMIADGIIASESGSNGLIYKLKA